MNCPIDLECPKPGCPNWDECHKLHETLPDTKWLPYEYDPKLKRLKVTALEPGWAEAEKLPYGYFSSDRSLRVFFDGFEEWGWAVALVLPYYWDVERECLEVWCYEKIQFGFAPAKLLGKPPIAQM